MKKKIHNRGNQDNEPIQRAFASEIEKATSTKNEENDWKKEIEEMRAQLNKLNHIFYERYEKN